MIDDVESFVAAAEVLKERGAYKIYILATHGLLSCEAPRLLDESPIDEVRFNGFFIPTENILDKKLAGYKKIFMSKIKN